MRRLAVILAALALPPAAATALADVPYEVELKGAQGELKDLLDRVSQLETLKGRPPASPEALRRRAEEDLARMAEAAHSLGYWSAEFGFRADTTKTPARVDVTVAPGPPYHVAAIAALTPSGRELPLAGLPLKPGDRARSARVVAAENALVAALGRQGHPFAKAGPRHVVIDRDRHTMAVTYRIEPGPRARFGGLTVKGLERLDPAWVERRARWKEGEVYDASLVERTRRALIESGLFSTVSIAPAAALDDRGRVAMTIEASERAHRTLGVGAGYNTSQGAAARAFWENRDLFGGAEYLKLSAALGQQQRELAANFRRPDVLAVDQDLLATAEVADDTPTAYHSRRARVSAGFERHFFRGLTGGVALSVEKANVVQLATLPSFTAGETTQHYAVVGLPIFVKRDTTDDLLNPTQGWRAQFSTTPYRSFSGRELQFVSNRVEGSAYWAVDADARAILAGRAALASAEGASLVSLPADKRIYAGGGGSVRAYGYQLAGLLDPENKPIGGKSSLDLSLEFRWRVTDTIGIVPFADAGSFYRNSLPVLDSRVLWGPGLGLRYYTPFGPVRLDLATPFDRRRGDSPIQVYISLGQAF